MTDTKELEFLVAWARCQGASVIVQEYMEANGQNYIESIQCIGLKGCGPYPMSPIYAAERLRELKATS